MLWIILTALAAPLQVARNALQRGLVGDAGPWGATLVRFLFGLPFSLAIFAVAALLIPEAAPTVGSEYLLMAAIGALAQMTATASLLVAMHRSGFAVATALQQSSLPFAALLGLAMGDGLSPLAWTGVTLATAGLGVLTWPRRGAGRGALSGALLGLASGFAFAIALNAYRRAGLLLEPRQPIYAAVATVCLVQAFQTVVLASLLAVFRRSALIAVLRAWRQSLGAGFCGAAASACWFAALALAPAGPVRAVGVIEMPIAAAAARRLFKEKLSLIQLIAGAITTAGVALAALG
jgi:drug/metabolite transporter (DMT)-like permease